MNKYKDSSPIETISNIRNILQKSGLFAYEPFWTQNNDFFHSVRIELDALPRGTNGKGTTKLFALASAYGELMERLQNRILIPKSYGWKESKDKYSYPDEEIRDTKDFLLNEFLPTNNYWKYEDLLQQFEERKSFNIAAPFYNATREQVEYLPTRFLALHCGTNGMSAGNTNEEAILHGICEILERFVIKKVILDEISLPNVPIEYFKDHVIYSQIQKLKRLGYNVLIRDCTLGGTIPVIGAILISPDKTGYCCRFGSELILEIALERCFTEMFQGVENDNISGCLIPIELDYHKKGINERISDLEGFSKNGKGQLPNSIFINETCDLNNLNVFYSNISDYNNEIGMVYLLDLLKKQDYQIYIRDLSFFDFPTFKIYIPGMSEIYLKDNETINEYAQTLRASKVFLTLNKCNDEEIQFLIDNIENRCADKTRSIRDTDFFSYSGLIFSVNDSIYKDIEINFFLSLLNIRIKNYKKAFDYLNDFVTRKRKQKFANLDYYMCSLTYLKLKAENKEGDFILDYLNAFFGNTLGEEVYCDLNNEDNLFSNFELPNCPDCNNCPIQNRCKFSQWESCNNLVLERINNNFKSQYELQKKMEKVRAF
jgi:ribosomal protein S12 methylthiotransferase accessory factor